MAKRKHCCALCKARYYTKKEDKGKGDRTKMARRLCNQCLGKFKTLLGRPPDGHTCVEELE